MTIMRLCPNCKTIQRAGAPCPLCKCPVQLPAEKAGNGCGGRHRR